MSDQVTDDTIADDTTSEEHESGLVVVEQDDGDDESRTEIEHPDKLLRLAGTVQGLLKEVRTTDLDEAGRHRLAEVHRAVVEELKDLVSQDLVDELEAMAVDGVADDASGGELRVAQAQLGGWLEGLFHGIRASVANRQAAMLQQAQQGQQAHQRPGQGSSQQTGQYL